MYSDKYGAESLVMLPHIHVQIVHALRFNIMP